MFNMFSVFMSNDELRQIYIPKDKPGREILTRDVNDFNTEIDKKIEDLFLKKEILVELLDRIKNRDLELIRMTINDDTNPFANIPQKNYSNISNNSSFIHKKDSNIFDSVNNSLNVNINQAEAKSNVIPAKINIDNDINIYNADYQDFNDMDNNMYMSMSYSINNNEELSQFKNKENIVIANSFQEPPALNMINTQKTFLSQQANTNKYTSINSSNNSNNIKLSQLKISQEATNIKNLICPDYTLFGEERLREETKKYGLKPCSSRQMAQQLKQCWEFLNINKMPDNIKSNLTNFLELDNINSKKLIQSNNSNLLDTKLKRVAEIIKADDAIYTKILNFKKIDINQVKSLLLEQGLIIETDKLRDYLSKRGVLIN